MAISADQTEGNRRQRRAKAATRKAMNMTSIWWAGESGRSFSGAGSGTPEGIDRGVEAESWWSWWWLVEGKRRGGRSQGGEGLVCTAPRCQTTTKTELSGFVFGLGNEVPTHHYVISVYCGLILFPLITHVARRRNLPPHNQSHQADILTGFLTYQCGAFKGAFQFQTMRFS